MLEVCAERDELSGRSIRSIRAISGISPRRTQRSHAADFVLVLDCDVPWIPKVNRPAAQAIIRHIDTDPLKRDIPLWQIDATSRHEADAATALTHI